MKKAINIIYIFLILSTFSLMGISCQSISPETRNYLMEMQAWKQRWDASDYSITSKTSELAVKNRLIEELKKIKPPRESVYSRSFNLDSKGNFYLYGKHQEYLDLLTTYVLSEQTLETILANLKVSWNEPEVKRYYISWYDYYYRNPSYLQANSLFSNADVKLSVMELQWEGVFKEYLQ